MSDVAAWQIATFVFVFGLVLLFVSALWEGEGPASVVATVRELGALFIVTGAVSILWDLRGRRVLTDEVLAAARLSTEVQDAGIRRIAKRYLRVDWEMLLDSGQRVDLFFTYAQTWRATHATDLRQLVQRDGARLRVVLPDPDDTALVVQLAAKFRYEPEELRRRINGAKTDFENLKQQACKGAKVELRLTHEFPVYTYYRVDRTSVVVLYAQAPGRFPEVPTFEMEYGGSLYRFFDEQFEALWDTAAPSD